MKYLFALCLILLTASCTRPETEKIVTMADLLDEMVDLKRLAVVSDPAYSTMQYSSYDRRSTKSTDSCWFGNEDGFGKEPVPGFEKVLREPGEDGIGDYLICDIRNPGVIVRLWTAGIKGEIRLYTDGNEKPFYQGPAIDFFWKTPSVLSGDSVNHKFETTFRQYDATYFPIPFAKACRIEWTGDIKELHFYHIGVRIYDKNTQVETFTTKVLQNNAGKLEEISKILKNPDENYAYVSEEIRKSEVQLQPGNSVVLHSVDGENAIEYFSVKINAKNPESVLRKTVLNVFFDNTSVPQIQSPLGDFFGAAPGLNPFLSLPFSVQRDSTMICRFIMPFRSSAVFELENNSGEEITVSSGMRVIEHKWEEGKTMHFRARWRIDHDLTASNINANGRVYDMLYLMASGKGRLVGASAFIYNPSNAVTPWGNWWGEGDEKIFIDKDTFPSFFGTGSEDYFNYSWSSAKIFSYPYCGQPRNDGPGNRGYVSNFRWHISDDIPFNDKLAFFMELGSHDNVPGFSYGRLVYFYAMPGLIDDFKKISMSDLRDLSYQIWMPKAYCGSAGYTFIQAEKVNYEKSRQLLIEKSVLAAGAEFLAWKPSHEGEKITFRLSMDQDQENTKIGLTLMHGPDGGIFSIRINGQPVKFDGKDHIDLFQTDLQILANHFSEIIHLKKGNNEISFESLNASENSEIGIDFFWIKEN